MDNRVAALRAASELKRSDALARANRAILSLENRGEAINFNTVAAEAGVSKGYLYRLSVVRGEGEVRVVAA